MEKSKSWAEWGRERCWWSLPDGWRVRVCGKPFLMAGQCPALLAVAKGLVTTGDTDVARSPHEGLHVTMVPGKH